MKHKITTFFIVFIILSMGGCASQSENPNTLLYSGAPDQQTTQNAETTLAESAASVSESLNELSAIEKSLHPGSKLPPPMIGGSMAEMATIRWAGPIEPLVRRIAGATGYRTTVVGKQPPTPVLVYIQAENKPLGEILRNVNFQGGSRATIIVYPAQRIIELRYLRS